MSRKLATLLAMDFAVIGLITWLAIRLLAEEIVPPAGQSNVAYASQKEPPANSISRELRKQVQTARHAAFRDGHFACCVNPPGSWCLLHNNGECSCALHAANRSGPCRECHGGWEAGHGSIPGISREQVHRMKTFPIDPKRAKRSPQS
jgi:hypothetical protein